MKKTVLLKEGKSTRGIIQIAGRQTVLLPATLYLMQLRTVPLKIAMPKLPRKIVIRIELDSQSPRPVKIVHSA